MEQVEGGDLIVNRGDESRPKDTAADKRDLNAVEGLEAAIKLAQARCPMYSPETVPDHVYV